VVVLSGRGFSGMTKPYAWGTDLEWACNLIIKLAEGYEIKASELERAEVLRDDIRGDRVERNEGEKA
jgi:hypothetical protein